MDNTWRSGMPQDLRQQHVDCMKESLQIYLDTPPTVRLVRGDLRTLALHLEEGIFLAATDQSDYAMKIFVRMLALETTGVTDVQESPGAVPIQNRRPLQKAVYAVEEVLADFPCALVTGSSSSEDLLIQLLHNFPHSIIMETSDGHPLIFLS